MWSHRKKLAKTVIKILNLLYYINLVHLNIFHMFFLCTSAVCRNKNIFSTSGSAYPILFCTISFIFVLFQNIPELNRMKVFLDILFIVIITGSLYCIILAGSIIPMNLLCLIIQILNLKLLTQVPMAWCKYCCSNTA